ncbi:unnamed protein product, partial [Owenia fusiformis]
QLVNKMALLVRLTACGRSGFLRQTCIIKPTSQAIAFSKPNLNSLVKMAIPMSTQQLKAEAEMAEFWKRNVEIKKRPLSPHLTVYKPELTSMLSICFRICGIAMSVSVALMSCTLLALPHDFPHYVAVLKDLQLPSSAYYGMKMFLCWPLIYHGMNGSRHLAWDAVWGFGLKTLYKSGWTVFALSFIIAATVASLPWK